MLSTTLVDPHSFHRSTRLQQIEGLGRSLVATRKVTLGAVIFTEKPLLRFQLRPRCRSSVSPHFSQGTWDELVGCLEGLPKSQGLIPGVPATFLAYLSLTAEQKKELEDFYAPDASWCEHPSYAAIAESAKVAVQRVSLFADESADELAQFCLKIYSNAHSLSGGRSECHKKRKQRRRLYAKKHPDRHIHLATAVSAHSRDEIYISLFPWASKLAHSCCPNTLVTYDPLNRALTYRAARDLEQGEVITFSYLPETIGAPGGLHCGGPKERDEILWAYKFFHCACERCVFETLKEAADEERRLLMKLANKVMESLSEAETTAVLQAQEKTLKHIIETSDRTNWVHWQARRLMALYNVWYFPRTFGSGLAQTLGLRAQGWADALEVLSILDELVGARRLSAAPLLAALESGLLRCLAADLRSNPIPMSAAEKETATALLPKLQALEGRVATPEGGQRLVSDLCPSLDEVLSRLVSLAAASS